MEGAPFDTDGGAAAPDGNGKDRSGRQITILLAEDDPYIRKLITTILRDEGYAVIATRDGVDAVQSFAEHGDDVDFLLFDLLMPRKNGWEAYCEIARIRPDIPHLFMSGYAGDIFSQESPDQDLDSCVVAKPFTPLGLLAKLNLHDAGGRSG